MKRLLSFLFALCSSLSAAQPNILFILTEDQGAHMGALGTTDVQTPNMEAALHGKSLKPLLEGQKDATGHDFIFAEVSGRSLGKQRGMEERSVLDATHQLIAAAVSTNPRSSTPTSAT